MINIAVFASGRGSNFAAIIKAVQNKAFRARLVLLICDNPDAGAILYARKAGIKIALVKREDFDTKKHFEKEITRHLKENKIGLICLAGFMRMLSPELVRSYRRRILNIHPALLPSFKGTHAIKDAFDYGVRVTGVTVHFVDEKMDHGPIVLQGVIEIKENDTPGSLEERIHKLEHKLYLQAIKLFVEGRLKAKGRKVIIDRR